MQTTTHAPKAGRPLFWGLFAVRRTHSRATPQQPLKAEGSRRFSFERCRPWASFCAGVSGVAAIVAAWDATGCFLIGDDIGALFFGGFALLTGVAAAYVGLSSILRGEA